MSIPRFHPSMSKSLILDTPLPTMDQRRRILQHHASQAIAWLRSAKPGAEMDYHTGLLLVDRLSDPVLDIIAGVYYLAGQEGYAELKQLRLEVGCTYLATRTAKRMTDTREELFRIKLEKVDAKVESNNGARIAERGRKRSVTRRVLQKAPTHALGGKTSDAAQTAGRTRKLGG